MNLEKVGAWFKSLLQFVVDFVSTAAPAAEAVGNATGRPDVAAAAKLAGSAADALDKKLDEAEEKQ